MPHKTVLNIWVADLTFPGYMDQWKKFADNFEERHPEYEVEIRGINFFAGPQEIATAIERGNPPAAAEYYLYLAQLARDTRSPDGKPHYTSLEKAIGGRTEILGEPVVIGDLIPPVLDSYTYGGELDSMPSLATTIVIYGNVELLESAGVTELPRTWQEIEAACEAVKSLRDGPSHGITWSNHGMVTLQALASQGATLADYDNGRSGRATTIDMTSTAMMEWVLWWKRLHDNGHYLYTGKIPDWEGTFRAFAKKQVAMRISSSNDVNYTARAAKDAGFTLKAGPYPYNASVPYAFNSIAGTSFWLADGLDEATRDGTLAFLQFAHNPRNAADRHKANSILPIVQSAISLLREEGWFEQHPYHSSAIDSLSALPEQRTADGTPAHPEDRAWPACLGLVFGDYAGAQDQMTQAIEDVLIHDADTTARFAEAQRVSQRQLEEYNAEALSTGPRSPNSLRFEFFTGAEPYSGADMERVARLRS